MKTRSKENGKNHGREKLGKGEPRKRRKNGENEGGSGRGRTGRREARGEEGGAVRKLRIAHNETN